MSEWKTYKRLNLDSFDLPDGQDSKNQKNQIHHKNHCTDYMDIPEYCKSAIIQDIRKNNYILTPGRYIDFKEVEEDGQAFDEKMRVLTATLSEQMQKSNELDDAIIKNLKKIGFEIIQLKSVKV